MTSRSTFAVDGQFHIDGLGAGTWEVETFTWNEERLFVARADVTLEGGEGATIQIELAEERQ